MVATANHIAARLFYDPGIEFLSWVAIVLATIWVYMVLKEHLKKRRDKSET